jgi:hypothetical protein
MSNTPKNQYQLDIEHRAQMAYGSARLLDAIKRARGELRGLPEYPPARTLLWGQHSGSNQGYVNYPQAAQRMKEEAEKLARVVSREPCPKCGIRADIGCKHKRPN